MSTLQLFIAADTVGKYVITDSTGRPIECQQHCWNGKPLRLKTAYIATGARAVEIAQDLSLFVNGPVHLELVISHSSLIETPGAGNRNLWPLRSDASRLGHAVTISTRHVPRRKNPADWRLKDFRAVHIPSFQLAQRLSEAL